jgi:hypothetical protein
VVGGEQLGPPPAPLRVDLEQGDLVDRELADVEPAAGGPLPRYRQAAERERVAERRQGL